MDQGKYAEAEPLFQRAIAIDKKALGPEHPGLATRLVNLGNLYRVQGKYEEAELLIRRAIAINEKTLGTEHMHTIRVRERHDKLLSLWKKGKRE